MDQNTICKVLESQKGEAQVQAAALLLDSGINLGSLGGWATKEMFEHAIIASTPDNVKLFSRLIADLIATSLREGHEDSDMHKAFKAFREAGIVSDDALHEIAMQTAQSLGVFYLTGFNRIVHYICGLEE